MAKIPSEKHPYTSVSLKGTPWEGVEEQEPSHAQACHKEGKMDGRNTGIWGRIQLEKQAGAGQSHCQSSLLDLVMEVEP